MESFRLNLSGIGIIKAKSIWVKTQENTSLRINTFQIH